MRGHLSDLVQAKNLKDELSRKLSQETLDNSRLIVRFRTGTSPIWRSTTGRMARRSSRGR